MKMVEDVNNYTIERRKNKFVPVCKSPLGGRCLKVLSYLQADDYQTCLNYFKGALKVLRKTGQIKN